MGSPIKWPDLTFPPINLWNAWRIDTAERQQYVYDEYFAGFEDHPPSNTEQGIE